MVLVGGGGQSMEEEREREKVRIYVGGLGESVSADELRRLFELAGGSVEGIDFMRTKGRSFAYVDFLPSSHKSLSNLFAKYNGCVWKGGNKLRLEKAKEHYLIRLTREWAKEEEEEEEKTTAHTNATEIPNPPETTTTNLRIFFPSFRKVKSLPLSGTGKHKYSFQRIDVPSLPNYFCDCEQHSSSTQINKQSAAHLDAEGGINEEELNIMNKVMNTLFQNQKDNNEQEEEEEEDNLIINVVTKENHNKSEASFGSQLQVHPLSKDEEPIRSKKRRPLQDVSMVKKVNDNEPPNKKKKSLSNDKTSGNDFESGISTNKRNLHADANNSGKVVQVQSSEPKSGKQKPSAHVSWSQKSSWRELVADKGSNSFSISEKLPDIASTEEGQPRFDTPNVPDSDRENDNLERDEQLEDTSCKTKTEGLVEEAQPADQNAVSTQVGRGASWRHKSSWTQLIGESSSFSVSQIVPGVISNQQVPTKPKDANVANSAAGKLNDIGNSAREDGPSVMEIRKEGEESRSTVEENQYSILGKNESSAPILEEKCMVPTKQTSPVKLEISDTCSFMRSATSLKEWAKTKATLSGSLKRKGTPK